MRERFNKNGFTGYHSHEVLEQVLFEVIPRCNTNEAGHLLIKKFGSIENSLLASENEYKKIEGLGPKSAEYLASLIDIIGEMIKEQYREISDLTVYQVAFLADWFMKIDEPQIGVIICDEKRTFRDFDFISYTADTTDNLIADFSDQISTFVGRGAYILVIKNLDFDRSFIFRLMDITRRNGSLMQNAYALEKRKPVSIIYPK